MLSVHDTTQAFILSEAHVHSYFSAGGFVGEQRLWDRQPQQEAGGELRRAAVALLVGKEELNLDYCMLLSVWEEWIMNMNKALTPLSFLKVALKAVFWRKRERKSIKHSEDMGKMKCKKESEQ